MYYTLIGRNVDTKNWEVIFGDYDPEVVKDEQHDCITGASGEDYDAFTIIKSGDSQESINKAISNFLTTKVRMF